LHIPFRLGGAFDGSSSACHGKLSFLQKTEIARDPNFALAYTGLARAYIERHNRFGGETSLLDSAVESCRIAGD
jgi:hypothetical protein